MPTLNRTYQLHLVTEPRRNAEDLCRAIGLALGGGVNWVQLRDKSASASTLYTQATRLLPLCRGHAAQLAINDRVDVALAAHADGVHLAGQSLGVEQAIELAGQVLVGTSAHPFDGARQAVDVGRRMLVGRSVHALEEAKEAAQAGADYVTFGHVFPTSTHPGLPPRGLNQLAAIVTAVDIPVLAIGGITVDNLPEVLATGCAGVAVISAILSDADPRAAAARLRRALDSSSHQPRTPWRQSDAAHHQPATV